MVAIVEEPLTKRIPFTLGRIDAGVAILVSDDLRTIEVPLNLLPFSDSELEKLNVGTIIYINSERAIDLEKERNDRFAHLQHEFHQVYSVRPFRLDDGEGILRVETIGPTTATFVWTSWDEIVVKSGTKVKLLAIDCWCNDRIMNTTGGSMAVGTGVTGTLEGGIRGGIRSNETMLRLNGLDPEQTYALHLVFRTSTGRFPTNKVTIVTSALPSLAELSVSVDPTMNEASKLKEELRKLGIQILDELDLEKTTYVVAASKDTPMAFNAGQASIPVLTKDWVKACKDAGRLASVSSFQVK